jgi:hypothetical protein
LSQCTLLRQLLLVFVRETFVILEIVADCLTKIWLPFLMSLRYPLCCDAVVLCVDIVVAVVV